MKALLAVVVLLVITTQLTFSQKNSEETNWPSNRVGGSASSFSGHGLSYQRHFGDDVVAKVSFFGYGDSYYNSSDIDELFITFGGEFQYNLHKAKYTRMHLFLGLSYWYDENSNWYYYDNNYYPDINRTMVTGIGFGIEFLAWGHLSINLETGWQGRFGVNTDGDGTHYPKYLGFGAGGGVSYAF